MADNDKVGKIGLDIEIDGDINKQIEAFAKQIGDGIGKRLEATLNNLDFNNIGKSISDSLDNAFGSIDETIKANTEKAKTNILKAIEEIKEKSLEAIKSIMANAKKIRLPINFSPIGNIPIPKQDEPKVATPRGPPKSDLNINGIEAIKAKIDNLSNSLEITNRRIEQEEEKLIGLRDAYNSTFNQARKNKLQEQILKTEASINKLISKSDATGFKLADLDKEFERLSSSAKVTSSSIDEANKSIRRTAEVSSKATRGLKNVNNSSRRYRENINGARSATGLFIDSMFKWGIVFPIIMKGLTAVGGYIGSALITNAQFANSLAQIRTNLIVAFMPIYQAVLPALNALMSGLANVTAYIAAFISAIFGKTYQASFGTAKHMNSSIAAMKNMEKQGKKTSNAVNGIGAAAKKAKGALSGFDEINKLSGPKEPKAKSGGIEPIPLVAPNVDLSPTSAAMQNINGMVGKLKNTLSKIFQPFKEAWATEGKATIDSIKNALYGIKVLLGSIGHSFMEVWTNGTGKAILETMLQILQNIFNLIGNIGVTFANAWNSGNIGTAIVQSLANAFLNILTLIKHMGDSLIQVWGEVGPGVASTFMQVLNATVGILENLSQKLVYVWDNGGSHLFQGFIRLGAKVFELAGYIYVNFVAPMVNWFVNMIAPVIAKLADILGIVLDAFSKLIGWLLGDGKPVLDTIVTVVGSLGASILIVKGALKLWTIAQTAWTTVATISTTATTLLGGAIAFLTSPIGIAIAAITAIIAIGVALYKNWDVIKAKAQVIWAKIKQIFYAFKVWLQGVFQKDWSESFGALGEILNGLLKNISNVWNSIKRIFNGIIEFIKGVFTGNWKRAWQGVKDIFAGIMGGLKAVIRAPLNGIIGLVNSVISGLNRISFTAPNWLPGGLAGKHFGVNLPKVPYLAKGGIVDKPTQALVGEAGTEAVIPLENNTGGLNLLANILSERISNMIKLPSTLQQPNLTMLGQNVSNDSKKDYDYLEKLKEAIIEALKEGVDKNDNNNNTNNQDGDLNLELIVGDDKLGDLIIKAFRRLERKTGKQILNI